MSNETSNFPKEMTIFICRMAMILIFLLVDLISSYVKENEVKRGFISLLLIHL